MINSTIAGVYAVQNSAAPVSPELSVLKIIGHKTSYDGTMTFTESGDSYGFPASAPIYNYATGEIEHIYQRYRIVDGSDVEYEDFAVCAIDGDFAICVGVAEFGTTQRVAITPYKVDGTLQQTAAWVSGSTLVEGVGVDIISLPVDYKVKDVVLIKPGKFIVITGDGDAFEFPTYQVYIITYTSATSNVEHVIDFNLADFGLDPDDYGFTNDCIRVAVDPNSEFIGVALQFSDLVTETEGSVIALVNTETYEIVPGSHIVDLDSDQCSALNAFDAIDETFYEFHESYFYYKYLIASHNGVKWGFDTNSYGALLQYQDYTSRTITGDAALSITYVGIGAMVTLDAGDLINTKLVALGLTPDGDPNFGGLGGYLAEA